MKQYFEEPVMEVILFSSNDVIATSGEGLLGAEDIEYGETE